MTFFERMRLQMMQNIEVILENFHISYETKSTTKLGHPFSFGFTLHYLKLIVFFLSSKHFSNLFIFYQTETEKNSKNKSKPIVYKVCSRKINLLILFLLFQIKQANSLSIYWNTKCESRVHLPFNIIIVSIELIILF